MAEPGILTHAYLRSHPAEAARELERQPSEAAAALFASVPVRLAAPAFGAMSPYLAARCLPQMEKFAAASLLSAIGAPAAAAVMRYLPERTQALLLDAVPAAAALAVRALLGYAEDSVGALMDSDIVVLAIDSRVADALAALRGSRVNPSAPAFLVDTQRRPVGQVALPTLLRADDQQLLTELMHKVDATLPALTSMTSADQHRVWDSTDVAPVVERSGALIGVVERRALNRAKGARARRAALWPETLPGLLTMGYWQAVAGLVDALLYTLPAERE